MSFVNGFTNQASYTTTENGAAVFNTTGNALLDLFARIGGMRKANPRDVEAAWLRARDEDKELADSLILYTRNIRDGGLGERELGRIMLKLLALKDPAKVARNLDTIVNAGRWDDLFVLQDTKVETEAFEFMKQQFRKDIVGMGKNESISLLAKWLPSINASSKETKKLGRKVALYFGLSERVYRKTLSALRSYLDVTEKKMSAKQFEEIEYDKVPSVAMTRYRSAFGRHDYERFNSFIQAALKGETKINASVSYPYELIKPYIQQRYQGWWMQENINVDNVLEAQWKNLPNYVEGEHNVIAMADISGSMLSDNQQPMATSVSLSIYFAERNTGAYKNLMMTFSQNPDFIELNPHDTVAARVKRVTQNPALNTNLDRAFAKIYEVARENNEAPDALVVISDGEIDSYTRTANSIVAKWRNEYAKIGLVAPKLIMWNVASRGNHYLAKKDDVGIAYISGSSASTFKELTTLIAMDAVTAMKMILSKPQFQWK